MSTSEAAATSSLPPKLLTPTSSSISSLSADTQNASNDDNPTAITAPEEAINVVTKTKMTTTATKTTTTETNNHHKRSHRHQHRNAVDLSDTTVMKQIVWRDLFFLIIGAIVLLFVSFVETNAPNASSRYLFNTSSSMTENNNDSSSSSLGIVDTGFMITTPIYNFLSQHQDWNDLLAAVNSIALILPSIYATYVTVWIGDYSLVFRILFTQLLRSVCGWFTYLPPDPTYLPSFYDFPDIVHCLFRETCVGAPQALPFVSFFSGHVATMVISGNHAWLHGHVTLASTVHALNVIQIVRLLATRGHYSIDIIIGWYMAVAVSNRAGRLGRYYSRCHDVPAMMKEIMPHSAKEAFETVTNITEDRKEARMSLLLKEEQIKDLLLRLHNDDNDNDDNAFLLEEEHTAETTLKMIHYHVELTAKKLQQRILAFQKAQQEKLLQMQSNNNDKNTTTDMKKQQ